MNTVPYPMIEPGTSRSEKIRLLSDQVSGFLRQGMGFREAVSTVVFNRYNSVHKELYREVVKDQARRSAMKRARIARGRMREDQLSLNL